MGTLKLDAKAEFACMWGSPRRSRRCAPSPISRRRTIPTAEHDFGAVTVDGCKLFFKVDYYDRSGSFHSPDPADCQVTMRVMTIMLAEEY